MSITSTLTAVDSYTPTSNILLQREKQGRLRTEASGPKVLVVGTTPDYIDLLRQSNPGRILYLTDQAERGEAKEATPLHYEEILCDIEEEVPLILQKIRAHLRIWSSSVEGVVCFDCESMELAASLAGALSLPYPSLESIRLCRDKFATKAIWQKNGTPCPRHRLVRSAGEVIVFLQEVKKPCVIKPLSGSGSELVFLCSSIEDCEKATRLLLQGLTGRKEIRLYSKRTASFVVEEFVTGNEFSCDFTVKEGQVDILRLTQKLKYTEQPFGTINGYMITDWHRAGINQEHLAAILKQGAEALGLADAICMVDFIVDNDTLLLLEMTPRPGGDCIPFLLKRAAGFDILSYFIDFSLNRQPTSPVAGIPGQGLVALRLHAQASGKVAKIQSNTLSLDSRIREVSLIREAGHRITMPPFDYDSWYLGYLIFSPAPDIPIQQQCQDLQRLLEVEIHNDDN